MVCLLYTVSCRHFVILAGQSRGRRSELEGPNKGRLQRTQRRARWLRAAASSRLLHSDVQHDADLDVNGMRCSEKNLSSLQSVQSVMRLTTAMNSCPPSRTVLMVLPLVASHLPNVTTRFGNVACFLLLISLRLNSCT